MTPREELIENIIDIVHATHGTPNDEKMAHFVKLLVATLKTHYAIGKWVPVSERLPERDARGNWTGIVKCRDGEVAPVIFNQKNTPVAVFTHWLELDLPEEEG